jgi:hypothetical protein
MESTFSLFKESVSEARGSMMRRRINGHARFHLAWSEAAPRPQLLPMLFLQLQGAL